ncbi:MAG: hypothetical protein GY864_00020 [Desulfobacterales bacterium]|nr:hypothetical protein [Desulfobacterales bacterium]
MEKSASSNTRIKEWFFLLFFLTCLGLVLLEIGANVLTEIKPKHLDGSVIAVSVESKNEFN